MEKREFNVEIKKNVKLNSDIKIKEIPNEKQKDILFKLFQ